LAKAALFTSAVNFTMLKELHNSAKNKRNYLHEKVKFMRNFR